MFLPKDLLFTCLIKDIEFWSGLISLLLIEVKGVSSFGKVSLIVFHLSVEIYLTHLLYLDFSNEIRLSR
jgi:hypothetical protein